VDLSSVYLRAAILSGAEEHPLFSNTRFYIDKATNVPALEYKIKWPLQLLVSADHVSLYPLPKSLANLTGILKFLEFYTLLRRPNAHSGAHGRI
jgi:hypothetical protein